MGRMGARSGRGLPRMYAVLFPISRVMADKFDDDYLEEAAKVFFYAHMAGNPEAAMMDLAPGEELELARSSNLFSTSDVVAVIRVSGYVCQPDADKKPHTGGW